MRLFFTAVLILLGIGASVEACRTCGRARVRTRAVTRVCAPPVQVQVVQPQVVQVQPKVVPAPVPVAPRVVPAPVVVQPQVVAQPVALVPVCARVGLFARLRHRQVTRTRTVTSACDGGCG